MGLKTTTKLFASALALSFSTFAFTAHAAPQMEGLEGVTISAIKPQVAPVKVDNKPNRIVMNFSSDPATTMAFNWFTTDRFNDAQLRVSTNKNMSNAVVFPAKVDPLTSEYAQRDAKGYYIYSVIGMTEKGGFDVDEYDQPKKILGYFTDEQLTRDHLKWTADGDEIGYLWMHKTTEHTNKVVATGLKPETKYYYQIGSPTAGFSDVGSFHTAARNSKAFQFIQYTDTQNAYWNANINNEAAYGANTLKKALEVAPQADFALHTGDFVEIAQVADEWVDNLDMSRAMNLHLPHVYAPGNHDEYTLRYVSGYDQKAFGEHTNLPITNGNTQGGSYYSFDYNGAHFVILNTNDNKKSADNPKKGAIGNEQMAWAKADIAKARDAGADWIILAYHKPVYSASYHALQDSDVQVTREEFVKFADELGVDLVLQGHDHNLTRTKSLVYTSEDFSYAKVEETEKKVIDGVTYHVNPKGVTYVIPNTSGTKAYDAIYQKGVEHVHKVRPRLKWMTKENVDKWNSLFDIAEQPEKSPKFAKAHDNYRQSTQQTFAVYTVTPKTLKIDIYMVEGDLHKGEQRKVKLRNSYGILKQK